MRSLVLALGFALTLPLEAAEPLPLSVQVALQQAQVDAGSLGLVVQALDDARPRLAWRADSAMNPASLTKLVTAMAALDTLGPAWQWQTPVWLTEDGGLSLQGSGDPRLTPERLWAGLKRLGVTELRGPLRLDRSAFSPGTVDPADFDGEPWRPGNVQPEALLLNGKLVRYTVRVDGALARISADPALDPPQQVPATPGACGDWRGALKLQWTAGQRPRFGGSFP
ncbi:MAG: D-alanyl-D-alanine carboxypeptidase, partial [Roseateles sp.]